MADVPVNYRNIVACIEEAAAKVGRDARKIRVLAAAKSQSVDAVRAAIAAGVELIGENYVQEAKAKKQEIRDPVEWHMIGHLQRNKAKAAVQLFDVIESLDSTGLAQELDKAGAKRRRPVRTLIEVNVGGEVSKSGIVRQRVEGFLKELGELPHITVEGLMTVPPFRDNPEDGRRYFRELAELSRKLCEMRLPNVCLKELSMGMSHDYRIAIEEGATIVRIGTALFGPRSS
jgi:pyridoxal phosphate enzyme (YggS family)